MLSYDSKHVCSCLNKVKTMQTDKSTTLNDIMEVVTVNLDSDDENGSKAPMRNNLPTSMETSKSLERRTSTKCGRGNVEFKNGHGRTNSFSSERENEVVCIEQEDCAKELNDSCDITIIKEDLSHQVTADKREVNMESCNLVSDEEGEEEDCVLATSSIPLKNGILRNLKHGDEEGETYAEIDVAVQASESEKKERTRKLKTVGPCAKTCEELHTRRRSMTTEEKNVSSPQLRDRTKKRKTIGKRNKRLLSKQKAKLSESLTITLEPGAKERNVSTFPPTVIVGQDVSETVLPPNVIFEQEISEDGIAFVSRNVMYESLDCEEEEEDGPLMSPNVIVEHDVSDEDEPKVQVYEEGMPWLYGSLPENGHFVALLPMESVQAYYTNN